MNVNSTAVPCRKNPRLLSRASTRYLDVTSIPPSGLSQICISSLQQGVVAALLDGLDQLRWRASFVMAHGRAPPYKAHLYVHHPDHVDKSLGNALAASVVTHADNQQRNCLGCTRCLQVIPSPLWLLTSGVAPIAPPPQSAGLAYREQFPLVLRSPLFVDRPAI